MKKELDSQNIILYDVSEVQSIFRLSRTKAYQLVSQSGFPAIKLNRRIYVPKDKLEQWIAKNCGKTFHY